MKTIMMDSNKYILTVPETLDIQALLRMQRKNRPNEIPEDFFSSHICLHPKVSIDGDVETVGTLPYNIDKEGYLASISQNDFVSFRPCLIPVFDDMTLDPYIKCNVPHGCMVKGGTMYLKGQPYKAKKLSGDLFSEITIGDSCPGKELSWISFMGKLICTQDLVFNTSLKALICNGIIDLI